MIRISSKKFFVIASTSLLVLTAVVSVILLSPQANALRTTSDFTYNNAGSISAQKILSVNSEGGDVNVEFKGTWPNYQTDQITWAACPNGLGDGCSSPPIDCKGVIRLVITSDDGATGQVEVTESGLGEDDGDSYDCKVAVTQNGTVTLKNPFGKDRINRATDRTNREATMTTYCQQHNQEIGAPPTALSGCVASMTAAFNACYDELGGGNGGTDNVITVDALGGCIASKTTVPKDVLTAVLSSAAPSNVTPGTPGADPGAPGTAGTSCRVDGIGWIICPVVKFMANIVDAAYSIVSSLLVVQPILSTGGDTSVFKAWEVMRNIANVAFVIAFLIIIFSQVTSVGISNYGIKKMLPRLVAAAILVNISFWICSIAVDLSNIIGASVNNVFHVVASQVTSPVQPNNVNDGTGWSKLTELVIAGGVITAAILYISLSALLPALVVALLAIVTVFVVLTVRQALIILLIVISPLAFVAFLLPNTESLFKKWRSLFTTMLLMFPIIGMMFGASALASVVVTQTATQQSNEGLKIAIQIMGGLIAIVPLVLTPIVMKAAGGVLGKVGAFVNNPNKGPFDRMKKGAEGIAKDRKNIRDLRGLNGKFQMPGRGAATRRNARTDAIRAGREAEMKRANSAYIANQAQNNSKFANAVAGGTNGLFGSAASTDALARALANAKYTIEKAEADEVKAEHAFVDSLDESALNKIIKNEGGANSDAKVAAALERLVKVGSTQSIQDAVNLHTNNGTGSSVITKSLANSLAADGPQFLKASDIDNIARGQLGSTQRDANGNAVIGADGREMIDQKSFEQTASANIEAGVYSQEKLVGANADELKYAYQTTSDAGKIKMADTAAALEANEVLRGKIKHNANEIHAIASASSASTTSTSPPTTPTGP